MYSHAFAISPVKPYSHSGFSGLTAAAVDQKSLVPVFRHKAFVDWPLLFEPVGLPVGMEFHPAVHGSGFRVEVGRLGIFFAKGFGG